MVTERGVGGRRWGLHGGVDACAVGEEEMASRQVLGEGEVALGCPSSGGRWLRVLAL